ncbi:MAG: Metalloregulation DNA-binding stress protein [Chlamydiales bacterium]|nr:Metalloregulation DNA-binding stress protein [Chlamydiales bacterium]MCH9635629.1 Metalloregulation DNA-binding stress protein [Chlamydiales bacterium]MCH9703386.1 DNA starvation/stationary phase protection protein [Chlamydiota bacterium]
MEEVAKKLSHFLADSYVLYIKTLNFHWNMTGPQFFMYHKLLESQYSDLADANDDVAERIRQLGYKAPGSMKEFLTLACMKESPNDLSDKEMIQELVEGHELMVKHAGELVAYCDSNGDPGTSDMIVGRMRDHDKQAWLLCSHFKNF